MLQVKPPAVTQGVEHLRVILGSKFVAVSSLSVVICYLTELTNTTFSCLLTAILSFTNITNVTVFL